MCFFYKRANGNTVCMYLGRRIRRYYDNTRHVVPTHPVLRSDKGCCIGVGAWCLFLRFATRRVLSCKQGVAVSCCTSWYICSFTLTVLFLVEILRTSKWEISFVYSHYADVFEWYWIKYNLSTRNLNLKSREFLIFHINLFYHCSNDELNFYIRQASYTINVWFSFPQHSLTTSPLMLISFPRYASTKLTFTMKI